MAEIPQHIQQRLAEVVNDFKNAVGQEAPKAYPTRISKVDSVGSESGAGDSWREFVNEDCINNASNLSYLEMMLLIDLA